MKKKLTPVLILAAILVIIAAVWQAKEAATLEDKLLEIDRQTQTERLWESLQFSCSVVSDFLQPHELQHARPPCPSPTPGVYPNSCPSSQ